MKIWMFQNKINSTLNYNFYRKRFSFSEEEGTVIKELPGDMGNYCENLMRKRNYLIKDSSDGIKKGRVENGTNLTLSGVSSIPKAQVTYLR